MTKLYQTMLGFVLLSRLTLSADVSSLPSPSSALDAIPGSLMRAAVSVDVPVQVDPNAPHQFYRLVPIPTNTVAHAERAAFRATPAAIESGTVAPILVSARHAKGVKATLIWTHYTATEFTIRLVHQDEGAPGPSAEMVAAEAKSPIPCVWSASVKLEGDTNVLSVCAKGSTNFSNPITVVP